MDITDIDDNESDSTSINSENDGESEQAVESKNHESRLATVLEKQLDINDGENADNGATNLKPLKTGRSPLYWFSSPHLAHNMSLGVYRALFTTEEQQNEKDLINSLRHKQFKGMEQEEESSQSNAPIPRKLKMEKHHFLCMIGGGHFAAMVVSIAPNIVTNAKGIRHYKANVIANKSFHRYTTRRKQGGAQSANDSAKGAAHSAGSSLRRHNEAALTNEVRELLASWKDMIDTSELLFVRATGVSNNRTLFGPYNGQILNRKDPRIRTFPFTTLRANQSELLRAFGELTRVKMVDLTKGLEEEEKELEAKKSSEAAKKSKSVNEKPKLTPEEELKELHASQLYSLIRRSKASAVLSYLKENNISTSYILQSSEHHLHGRDFTALHLAAMLNSHVTISAILSKARADPTTLDAEGKTPFELCTTRQSREAFRMARDDLGEEAWDWAAAKVPSPLKRQDVEEREKELKREAEEKEEKRRQSEIQRLSAEREEERRNGTVKSERKGKTLASVYQLSPEEKRQEEVRGMTPAAQARLERERRARAAEERMKRLKQ